MREREGGREKRRTEEEEKVLAKCSLMMQSELYNFIGFELRTSLKLKELRNENGELWVGRDWTEVAPRPVLWF